MYFIEKVLTTVLSAAIFALLLTYETGYFKAAFIISLPVFLIAGSTCSYFIEFYVLEKRKIKKPFNKYIASLILYGLAGIISITIFVLFQGNLSEISLQPLIILGLFPAIIYFHIGLLCNFVLSKVNT